MSTSPAGCKNHGDRNENERGPRRQSSPVQLVTPESQRTIGASAADCVAALSHKTTGVLNRKVRAALPNSVATMRCADIVALITFCTARGYLDTDLSYAATS